MNNVKGKGNILNLRLRIAKRGAGGLQNTKTKLCALLLFSVMIVALFALSPAFSSLINSVVINTTGEISLSSITAKSGSPADIQSAVNAVVAAGGGTVYVPAGTFAFNPPLNGVGITIPCTTAPINIIGAGCGTLAEYGTNDTISGASITVLEETQLAGNATMFQRSWSGQSYSGAPIRISGISFVGMVNLTAEGQSNDVAMSIPCTTDFRVDHCNFVNFEGWGISTGANTGGTHPLIDRGVIDHCSFDNPYKTDEQPYNASGAYYSVWGYGIIVYNDYYTWDPNIADYLGNYYNVTTYLSSATGQPDRNTPIPQPIYIENCNFSRCRHAISSNGAGFYVARYDYFQQPAPYGQCDMHGDVGTPAWGSRGSEVYSCLFNLADNSYTADQIGSGTQAFEPRGGGGVYWNNTVITSPGSETLIVGFGNDGESAPYDVEQLYIWNNTAMYSNGTTYNFDAKFLSNSLGSTAGGSTSNCYVNVNYFLFAPNGTNANGLTGPSSYTPYTYPLPLTLTGAT